MSCYSTLLDKTSHVADKTKSYQFLTERHLQAMWLEQKYFKPLHTISGELIEVISPGIWNADAGPDFLKAHIKIGPREYRGDIEIHLLEESWYQHGHNDDERYNDVILHVSLWKPKNEVLIKSKNGRVLLQTYLEHNLTIPHSRIVQLIDLDLYPYKKFIGSGRCAQTLFRTLPEKKIVAFFKSAAAWRLEKKADFLKAHVSDPSLRMGAGVAMALGYKNNTQQFLNLFLWLSSIREAPEEVLLALGMHACGFFGESYHKKWTDSPLYSHLNALALKFTSESFPKFKLELNQIRPLNHPIRRLVVLSKLIKDPAMPILFHTMELCWRNNTEKQIKDLLPTYCDPYWNTHYSFEKESRNEMLSLMGEDLKDRIIINTFLPLLSEQIVSRGDPEEINAFENFYSSFSAEKNSKTKYLIHRFFGDGHKGEILNRAETEQGAYQLHRDFCLHYEASCFGCPFVDRFKQNFHH